MLTVMRRLVFLFALLLPALVYSKTLARTVQLGDSGELIAAAVSWGIPHPPGSPSWVFFAHLFTKIPVGDVVTRVHAFSAFSALVCIGVAYLLLTRFLSRGYAHDDTGGSALSHALMALVTVLTIAFSLEFWTNSVTAEVYMFHTLLSLLILACTLWAFAQHTARPLFAAWLLLGIALTNHYLAFLLGPPLGLLSMVYWWQHRQDVNVFRFSVLSAFSFVCGLTFLLLLPLRSRANPLIDWGNPETLPALQAVIGRKQFSAADKSTLLGLSVPISQASLGVSFPNRIWHTVQVPLSVLGQSYGWPLVFLFGMGWVYALLFVRKGWVVIALFALSSGPALTFLLSDTLSPYRRYPAYLPWIVLAGVGLFPCIQLVSRLLRRWMPRAVVMVPLAALVVPLLLIRRHFVLNDYSNNRIADTHARQMLATFAPNAVVFAEENDWVFPLLVVHNVEGVRPDVSLYDRNGNLFTDVYAEAKKDFRSEEYFESQRRRIEQKIAGEQERPAYYAVDKPFENYGYSDVVAQGPVYRVADVSVEDPWKPYQELLSLPYDTRYHVQGGDGLLAHYHMQYGEWLYGKGQKKEATREFEQAAEWGKASKAILNNLALLALRDDQKERAYELLRQSLVLSPKNPIAHNVMGTISQDTGDVGEAEASYRAALAIDPQHIPALKNLSRLLIADARKEDATPLVTLLSKLVPGDPEVAQLQQALTSPAVPKAYSEALKKAETGDCAAALALFEDVIAENPTYLPAFNNAGVCAARQGDFVGARSYWERTLSVDPDNAFAQEQLERLKGVE